MQFSACGNVPDSFRNSINVEKKNMRVVSYTRFLMLGNEKKRYHDYTDGDALCAIIKALCYGQSRIRSRICIYSSTLVSHCI